ncbi:MAG TPA: AzlD domain-containing protein [Chloroflexota bacterium]|nr:AzlD domain-containing protein [Chloroflexota bacterium]
MSGDNVLAIIAMAVATYSTRIGGMLLGGHLPKTGRVRQALDALPAALLTAVVTPAVIAGPAEMVAAGLTLLAALRLPIVVAVLVGMGSVAILRAVGF